MRYNVSRNIFSFSVVICLAKNKYYAVKKGWKTGIFDNFFEYFEAVTRYPKPESRGFSTFEEADKWFKCSVDEKNNIKAYYAVKVGKKPGIYTTAKDMEKQTKGFPGALAKKFSTREDAENWLYHNVEPVKDITVSQEGNNASDGKIYAVKQGFKIGLFINKKDFEDAVRYHPKPIYNTFTDMDAAKAWFYGKKAKPDKKKKYYAVKRGRETGVFESAYERNKQIEHYPDALSKIFYNEKEAYEWLSQTDDKEISDTQKKYYCIRYGPYRGIYETKEEFEKYMDGYSDLFGRVFELKELADLYMEDEINGEEDVTLTQLKDIYDVVAFVDGSIRRDLHWFSYGIVLFHNGKEHHFKQKYTNNSFYEVLSDAGELKGAMKVMKYAKDHGAKRVAIFHDSAKIADLANRVEVPTGIAHQDYIDFYDEMVEDGLYITFYKVKAHSNNHYNDLADELAKDALNFDTVPRSNKNNLKYYVVKKGRTPGIYSSYDEANQQTVGYPNALMKGFNRYDSAERWFYADNHKINNTFYAVKAGRTKGIFYNLEDYLESIEGFPGAIGRVFESIEKAVIWMNETDSCGSVYAVKKGNKTGIFYDADTYKSAIAGYSEFNGRKFHSVDEAVLWLNKENRSKTLYVVIRGRKPGIYNTLDSALEQVVNFPDAYFRVAATVEEAQFLFHQETETSANYIYAETPNSKLLFNLKNPQSNLLKPDETFFCRNFKQLEQAQAYADGYMNKDYEYITEKMIEDFDIVSYVHGGYDANTERFSYGLVLFDKGNELHFKQLYKNNPMKFLSRAAGEIKGAMKAMNYAISKGAKSLVIVYGFLGVESWALETYSLNLPYLKQYKELYRKAISSGIEIRFFRVGHNTKENHYLFAKNLANEALKLK